MGSNTVEWREPKPDRKPEVWCAHFMSYAGIVGWATHWTVKLSDLHEHVIEVEWLLDARTAAKWTRADRSYEWKEGSEASRFDSREEAVRAAITVFEAIANPETDLLVEGEGGFVAYNIAKPLAGDPTQVAWAQKLYDAAEKFGWYEGDKEKMRLVLDEWESHLAEHFEPQSSYDDRTKITYPPGPVTPKVKVFTVGGEGLEDKW